MPIGSVLVDVLFDPFGGRWDDLRLAALAAERAGFDGLWLYDHLAGSVHRAPHVLECWTTMTALAAVVPRLAVGPLVLNVANRHPGTLAVMAATLQHVSGGRLVLGLGAGGGRQTPYYAEQRALGRTVAEDPERRRAVAEAVATMRQVWSGTSGGVSGFLRPDPPPPVIIGGFGPKMAELAGRVGDGINVPGGPGAQQLISVARTAHAASGRDPDAFVVTASARPSRLDLAGLADAGVARAIIMAPPPYLDSVHRLRDAL